MDTLLAISSKTTKVNLTRAEYQQLLGLLNSQCHFGTHQVANIITQPSVDLQGHELLGIWSFPSLEYLVFL